MSYDSYGDQMLQRWDGLVGFVQVYCTDYTALFMIVYGRPQKFVPFMGRIASNNNARDENSIMHRDTAARWISRSKGR